MEQKHIQDPRTCEGFLSNFYPRANAKDPPPPDATSRNDRVKLEFLAAYYELNRLHARLLSARQEADPARRDEAEHEAMLAIEKALIIRDALEDRYAPFGVIAAPVVVNGFITDLTFSFGNVDAAGRLRSEVFTIEARIPIPLPKGIQLEDVPMRIEGPGFYPQ